MKFIRDLLARKKSDQSAPLAPLEEVRSAAARTEETFDTDSSSELHSDLPKGSSLKVVTGEEAAEVDAASEEVKAEVEAVVEEDTSSDDLLKKINADFQSDAAAEEAKVNIWDLDEGEAPAEVAEAPKPRRRRRNQTRLLGFDADESNVVSPFEAAEKVAPTARAKFPVGWVVVADGPGRGECFSLEAGMSQIGRGEDQAIQLDFGDNAISRMNHAAIVYDQETHTFFLGHGGKKNVVRLNNKPVISNEELKSEDEIKVGETTLRFMALCSADFNWANQEDSTEEQDHVAIA